MKFQIFKFNQKEHTSSIKFDDMSWKMLMELCSLGYRVELKSE